MTHVSLSHPPEEMTRRARAYLSIGGVRHLLIGGFTLAVPQNFASTIYIPIISYMPLAVWGVVFVVTGAICIASCLTGSGFWARLGLVLSATSTLACGVGITIGCIEAWLAHQRLTPITAILLVSLAAKDYAVCTQPLRSPFEALLQRVVPKEAQQWNQPPSGA